MCIRDRCYLEEAERKAECLRDVQMKWAIGSYAVAALATGVMIFQDAPESLEGAISQRLLILPVFVSISVFLSRLWVQSIAKADSYRERLTRLNTLAYISGDQVLDPAKRKLADPRPILRLMESPLYHPPSVSNEFAPEIDLVELYAPPGIENVARADDG